MGEAASGETAVGLCKDESEFVKKRPGTPGLALASFFSSRARFARMT